MSKRWRKQPNEKGLLRICQGKRGLELRENEEIIAHVNPLTVGDKWYWCGFGQNTCRKPVNTKEQAKQQVIKYIKKNSL